MSRKRPSVASRYLAAIDCAAGAGSASLPPSVTRHEAARALSPPTSTWKEQEPPVPLQSDSFSSGKSPIQTRSTGNSPSSSRRSRASRTPPRDAAVDLSCNSISPFGRRNSFFPATTSALHGRQQQQHHRAFPAAACVDQHDTDESSLTNSRSSTPPLCEEDDRFLERRDELRRDSPPEENWRDRLERIASSYKRQDEIDNSHKRQDASWIKKKAPPRQVGKSPRSSPNVSSETADVTEVMMNLSSKRRSSDAMTDVTGISTEIITNRAVDLHRKLLKRVDVDERHPIDRLARRPQHEQQEEDALVDVDERHPMVRLARRPQHEQQEQDALADVDERHPIVRLARRPQHEQQEQDALADVDERHPIVRLARRPQHEQQEVGALQRNKLPSTRLSPRRPIDIQGSEPPQRRPIDINSLLSDSTNDESGGTYSIGRLGRHVRVDSKSVGSFQERSLTSSVGVELGVHSVTESSPALKRVFAPKLDARLSPQREVDETRQKVAFPLSPQQDSISSNPFLVQYSARGSPITERHRLYDVGSPRSMEDSSGGWTPVPLSSSGMISEDFVLDPHVTPTGKNVAPIKPLFSADRVPSTSRSPFHNFYRPEPSSEPSIDSDKVGPPDIRRVHRVTADPSVQTVPMRSPESGPDGHRVTDTLTVPASTPPETNRGMTNDNANQSTEARPSPTQILSYSHARRRSLQNRWQLADEEHDPDEQHHSPGVENAGLNDAGTKLTDAVEKTRSNKSPVADTVVPRNLFPSKEATSNAHPPWASKSKGGGVTYKDDKEGFDRNVGEDVEEAPAVLNEINDYRMGDQQLRNEDALTLKSSPPSSSLSVRDRINAFTPSKDAANYVPPWALKLKGKGVINKDKEEGFDRDTPVGDGAKESIDVHAALGETDGVDHEEKNNRKPLHSEEVKDTSALKSTPPSLSVRDRIRAFSGGKNEPSRLTPINLKTTVDVSPSKRGDSETRDGSQPVISPTLHSTSDDNKTNSGMVSRLPGNRLSTGTNLFDAVSSQEMLLEHSSEKIQVSKGAKEPREAHTASDETNGDDYGGNNRWKPPLSEWVEDTTVLKSSPQSLSVRDRIRAFSGGKSELSRLTPINFKSIVDASPSKRGDSESRDGSQPVTSTTLHSTGDDTQTNSGMTSPFSANRLPAGAIPIDVDTSQEMHPEDSLEKIQVDVREHKTSRSRLLLGAHLAATVDDVSPQDRYRWRSMIADDTTATDDSREISDVRSLRSLFEASLATAPSDESGDDDDDRTVESLRSMFEPAPAKEEEPSAVSKMRALFEKPKSAATSQKFSGNNAVSDAFTMFQSSAPRRSPTKSMHTSKFISPFASPEDDLVVLTFSAEQEVTKSAPSKLQTAFQSQFVSEEPEAKTEDVRDSRKSASVGKTNERVLSDLPVMSVAERIRSLRLKQSPEKQTKSGERDVDDASKSPSPLLLVSPRSTKVMNPVQVAETSAAVVSAQPWKWKKPSQLSSEAPGENEVVPRDPKITAELKPTFSPSADYAEKDDSAKLSSRKSVSYPSVMDRINVFSGNIEKKMSENNTVLNSPANLFQRVGVSQPQLASADDETEGNILNLSTRAVYGRQKESDNVQHELRQKSSQRRAQPTEGNVVEQGAVILQQKAHDAQQLHSGGERARSIRAGMIITKKPLKSESNRVSGDAGSGTGSEFDDGVTLDVSIAEISQLTNPTCLHEGGNDSSSGEHSSVHASGVEEQVGKGPSEASSSQPSEAMVPLIARMRFSDDGSASVHAAKGAWSERSSALKWEQLTAVDETTKTPPTTKEQERAWSPDDINASFPVSASHFDTKDEIWQPLQAENWETSVAFGTNWTPPIDPFETPTSEARLSDNTPIRRNTTPNPSGRENSYRLSPIQRETRGMPQSRGSHLYVERKQSPINGTPFRRTHPTRYEEIQKKSLSQPTSKLVEEVPRSSPPSRIHGSKSPTIPATPRSSPLQSPNDAVANQEVARSTRGSPPTGSSKHVLLMSKLRSLKEARMRRNAAAGFRGDYLSERQSRRPPTGNARTSPPTSALAPFLRPSFGSPRQTRSSNITQYRDRRPEHTVDDEYSTSTSMSMDFGGHKFTESLDVD